MPKRDSNAPKYKPTTEHIKNVLLFYFRQQKDASEAHDSIVEAYGEESVTLEYCEHWYKIFDNGDTSLEECGTAPEMKEELD